jgi:hypothetical protein
MLVTARTMMYVLIVPMKRSARRAGMMRPGMPVALSMMRMKKEFSLGISRARALNSRT